MYYYGVGILLPQSKIVKAIVFSMEVGYIICMEPKPVQLQLFDKPFTCTVCGTDTFHKKQWEFKPPGSAFLKTGDRPVALICTKCGYVHCFMPHMGEYHKEIRANLEK